MKPAQYLLNNIKWTFSRPDFSLIGTPTTAQQLFDNLQNFCQQCQPNQALAPTCDFVKFSLNQVFLSKPTNQATRHLKTLYFHYANKLANAQKVLDKCPPLPAQNGQIVLQQLAKNFVKNTQACKTARLWQDYCNQAQQYLQLTQQERGYLDAFYDLYLCQYYAMLYKLCKKDDKLLQICNLTNNFDLIYHKWVQNDYYSRNFYKTSQLFSALDCFCNSATIFDGKRTDAVFNLRMDFNKRNAFDTFLQHKFGKKSANFRAQGGNLDVVAHYHAYKNYEVRNYFVVNTSKKTGKLDCVVKLELVGANTTHFVHNNTCCFAKKGLYVALVCLVDGSPTNLAVKCSNQPNAIKAKTTVCVALQAKQSSQVCFVVVYASSVEMLSQSIDDCHKIGFANAYAYKDDFTHGEVSNVATKLSAPASNLYEKQPMSPAKSHKYCYQMGDVGVATLVDDTGNNVTLLDGFVSSGGEGVYAVCDGKITKLNCGKPQILCDGVAYVCPSGQVDLSHKKGCKIYQVTTPKASGVLFILPLEQPSKVQPIKSAFQVVCPSRSFTLSHNGQVQSLTTNALECNPSRLRCKLSGDIASGNTLALYFSKCNSLQITLCNDKHTDSETPIVSGDEVSKQLANFNAKTVFFLANKLDLPRPLNLASTAYTHPRWLKNYLNSAINSNFEYCFYNAEGKKRYKQDDVATYFGALYLALVGYDTSTLTKLLPHTESILQSSLPLAYKALIVKKLADLDIDKVSNLVKHNQYKKQMAKDKHSLTLAQVIGATVLNYPSTQRVADLCKQHQLPKCWQWVAHYEVLCKLELHSNKIVVKPVLSSQGFSPSPFVVNQGEKQTLVNFVPSKICSATYMPTKGESNTQISGQIIVKH